MLLMMRLLVMSNLFLNLAQAAEPKEATVRTYKLQLFENGKYYTDAQKDCEKIGAWLVDITDKEIENKVLSIKNSHDVWIGLTHQDGVWKWGDGSQPRYFNWKNGQEPTLADDECISLDLENKYWTKYKCSMSGKRYVCQSDAVSGNNTNNTCLNGGACDAAVKRCHCTCVPGYFGTRCEKELISLSTNQSTNSLIKRENLNITIDVQSYDGNVDIAWHEVSNGQQRSEQVYLEKPGARASWRVLLGMQLANTTYRFEATPASPLESNSYTKTLDVTIIVEDYCKPLPCKNSGICNYKTTSPYYKCACNGAYGGLQCQEIKFFTDGNCQYHVYMGVSSYFKEANTACVNLGGTLAMLKTAAAQGKVEKQFIGQYGNSTSNYYELWIGGNKIGNTWYWLDRTKISQQDQRWKNPANYRLIISTWPSKSVNNMDWKSKYVTSKIPGYVCEKSVKDPCVILNCSNGGACVTLGCQAKCYCAHGFGGKECEIDLVIIVPANLHSTVEEGKSINVSVAINSRDGFVKLHLYNKSITSLTLLATRTTTNLNETVIFTIGPFYYQTPNETYVFEAISQSGFADYSRSATIKITAEGPPLLKINQSFFTLPVARETAIKCTGFGVPIPLAYWQRNNKNITEDASAEVYQKKVGSTAILHFSITARNQAGNFMCYARNIVRGRTKIANRAILVQATSRLLNSNKVIPVNPVLLTAFSCTFEAYPEPDIRWKWEGITNTAKYIDSNGNGSVFKINTENEKMAPLFVKTSTLSIILTQYLDSTTVYCETNNTFGKVINQSFTFNQNILNAGDKSYKIYNKNAKNYTEAKSLCRIGGQELANFFNSGTYNLLASKLQPNSLLNVFIGGQRHIHDGKVIWKWNNGEILYDETKHGKYDKSSVGVVDGHFVAWNKDEPAGDSQDCLIMNKSKSWRWSSAKCSETHGFVCESTIAGIPKNFKVSVDQCSIDIVVSWKTAPKAFGITHRLDIVEVNNSQNNDSAIQIPKNDGTITKKFNNKGNYKTYDVKVTVCPECPQPYSISKRVTTSLLVAAKEHTFLAANVNSTGSGCHLFWRINSSAKGIIVFKILVHSILAHVASKKHELKQKTTERNVSSSSRQYVLDTQPNRKYTFVISVITCLKTGSAFKFGGECISENAAPLVVPNAIISSAINDDDTMTIQVIIPHQTNGPLSCIFVIVIYKPIGNSDSSSKYGKEYLQNIMANSAATSLMAGDSYIALAIPMTEIATSAYDAGYITRTLGDGRYSACDIGELNHGGTKRSTKIHRKIFATNRKLEDETEYKYFTVTATPGQREIYFTSSKPNSFRKIAPSDSGTINNSIVIGIVVPFVAICVTTGIVAVIFNNRKKASPKAETISPYESTYFGVPHPSNSGEIEHKANIFNESPHQHENPSNVGTPTSDIGATVKNDAQYERIDYVKPEINGYEVPQNKSSNQQNKEAISPQYENPGITSLPISNDAQYEMIDHEK